MTNRTLDKRKSSQNWDSIVVPEKKWFDLKINEIAKYKDLLLLFVRRDIVVIYKQTVLGPIWYIVQPILTTLVFTMIFGKVAKISTDSLPPILFYLSGVTVWSYFASCLNGTSNVFTKNQHIFGKVYFPRAIVPLSIVLSNLIKFGIQFVLFLAIWAYYYLYAGSNINMQVEILLFPGLIMAMALLGLGFGMVLSALTSKYRDLSFLVSFGVQLLMYATPVVYPASIVQGRFEKLIWLNPMTSIVEAFRFMFLGEGMFDLSWLGYTFCFSFILFLFGLSVFNRTEKNFMDTV